MCSSRTCGRRIATQDAPAGLGDGLLLGPAAAAAAVAAADAARSLSDVSCSATAFVRLRAVGDAACFWGAAGSGGLAAAAVDAAGCKLLRPARDAGAAAAACAASPLPALARWPAARTLAGNDRGHDVILHMLLLELRD